MDRRTVLRSAAAGALLASPLAALAEEAGGLDAQIAAAAAAAQAQVVALRRRIHADPELSNREFRTSALVAEELKRCGFDDIRTKVAHTGVVGVLRGGRPGPVVALRADMDAVPVTEATGLPFASKARGVVEGREVGVSHACGHDAHTAMLLGAAHVLSSLKSEWPGTIKFIFQPAEEFVPTGEEGGAALMLKEGVFSTGPRPQAIFAVHAAPFETGNLLYRAGPAAAAADVFKIVVRGDQVHAAMPWLGVDAATVAAQIVLALQTIPSRNLDITKAPSLISVGEIHGGAGPDTLPASVAILGTIRTFDKDLRAKLLRRVDEVAKGQAAAAGATAEVTITPYGPAVVNDPALTARSRAALVKAAGEAKVREASMVMGAEDFAFYAAEVPGFYAWLGVNPPGAADFSTPPNHSPGFTVYEPAMEVGVRALSYAAVDFLRAG